MINSLQSLRGIFAIVIFMHHFPVNGKGLFEAGGAMGVEFFLLLSGFVMCAGYESKADSDKLKFDRFFLKRVIRVYPLHLLCLVGFIAINILHLNVNGVLVLLPNLLLLQSWIPVQSVYFSGNAVSWCLSDLMFFYAVFPWIIKFLHSHNKAFYLIVGILTPIYLLGISFLPESLWHPLIYISPAFRLFDFILGIVLWQIWIECRESSHFQRFLMLPKSVKTLLEASVICLTVLAVIVYPHVTENYSAVSMWWIPMLAIILMFTLFNNRGGYFSDLMNWKPLVTFGYVSFSFYMIHQLGISIISRILDKLRLDLSWPQSLTITLFIIIVISYIVYTYFETPISRKLISKLNDSHL